MICVIVDLIVNTKNVVENKMNDKKPTDITVDLLIADAMLRITVLEKLLISKGVFSKEELLQETTLLIEQVSKVVMNKVESSKDLNDFISSLTGNKKVLDN